MNESELRKVPVKNYIILGVVVLVTVLFMKYLYLWYSAYEDSRLSIPIMVNYMDVINYNELDNFLTENPNSIIYVSVLNDDEIRKFERTFKRAYKDNLIDKDILYLNITDDIKDVDIYKYSLEDNNIKNVPCIMVFSDGKLSEMYNVSSNNYDINKLVIYINNINMDDEIK